MGYPKLKNENKDRKAHGVGMGGQVQKRKEMDKSGKKTADVIHYIPKMLSQTYYYVKLIYANKKL